MEQGNSSLSVEGLAKAAVELGVSTEYLLGLTDDSAPAAQLLHQVKGGISPDSQAFAPTPTETQAVSIARGLQSPLLEGWRRSSEALLELQRLSA